MQDRDEISFERQWIRQKMYAVRVHAQKQIG